MKTRNLAPAHNGSRHAPQKRLTSLVILIALWSTSVSSTAQVTISETYTQNFDSLGTALPEGWAVWTSSTDFGNGQAYSWAIEQVANNAGFASGGAFRNVPGASQNWHAGLLSGNDRALGWRAGSAASRDGSITFTLSETAGYALSDMRFQLFTPNSAGTSAPIELEYQIGPGAFTSFNPSITYVTDTAQSPLAVTWLTLTAAQLEPLNDQSAPVTFSFRNTYGSTGGITDFNSIALDNFSYTASAVPESSACALICGGIALLGSGIARWRKIRLGKYRNTVIGRRG